MARLENHLKDTHKIRDKVVYRKLLKIATLEAPEAAAEDSLEDSDEEVENDNRECKSLIRGFGTQEVFRLDNEPEELLSDNEDSDWFVNKLKNMEKERYKTAKRAMKALGMNQIF